MTSYSTPVGKTFYTHTCRACLGSGCVHCSNRGQIRERVFRRKDAVAAGLRALLLGTTGNDNPGRVKRATTLKELCT